MKKPVFLIVGAAAGAMLVAGIGASAHTFTLSRLAGVHTSAFGDEATGARTQKPEPTDTPEAQATAEPTDTPAAQKPPEPADTDTDETNDQETNNQEGDQAPATTTTTTSTTKPWSGEHGGGGGGSHNGGGGD
jgi:hypothetical protein